MNLRDDTNRFNIMSPSKPTMINDTLISVSNRFPFFDFRRARSAIAVCIAVVVVVIVYVWAGECS